MPTEVMARRARGFWRSLLLLAGAATAVLLLHLGVQAVTAATTLGDNRLGVQGGFQLLIGVVAVTGVALSSFAPRKLAASTPARRFLVAGVLAQPLVDLYALGPDLGLSRTLLGHLLVSTAVGCLLALAIATSWLRTFRPEP